MPFVLIGLFLALVFAFLQRLGISHLKAQEFQPELADTFANWQRLKLRRLDVFIATLALLFTGIGLFVWQPALGDFAPILGIVFWGGLIWSFVLGRKVGRLEEPLMKGRITPPTRKTTETT